MALMPSEGLKTKERYQNELLILNIYIPHSQEHLSAYKVQNVQLTTGLRSQALESSLAGCEALGNPTLLNLFS